LFWFIINISARHENHHLACHDENFGDGHRRMTRRDFFFYHWMSKNIAGIKK
jgi:hypothetical protein